MELAHLPLFLSKERFHRLLFIRKKGKGNAQEKLPKKAFFPLFFCEKKIEKLRLF
jgi:hypothetical protein